MALTPLGKRTLQGFIAKYGKQGEAKFRNAIDKGLLDGSKMMTGGAADNPSPMDTDTSQEMPDAASAAASPTAGMLGPQAALTRAAAAGRIAGVDTTEGIKVPANPRKAGTRRVPTGLARAAGGTYQRRTG